MACALSLFLLHQPLREKFPNLNSKMRKNKEPILVTNNNQPKDGKLIQGRDGLPWIHNINQCLLFVPLLDSGMKCLEESHTGLKARENHQGD